MRNCLCHNCPLATDRLTHAHADVLCVLRAFPGSQLCYFIVGAHTFNYSVVLAFKMPALSTHAHEHLPCF